MGQLGQANLAVACSHHAPPHQPHLDISPVTMAFTSAAAVGVYIL